MEGVRKLEFLYERKNRIYTAFTVGMCVALVILFGGIVRIHSQSVKRVAIEREKTIISALLEAGVEESTVAEALKNENVTKEGEAFLGKTGHTADTQTRLLSAAGREAAGFGIKGMVLVCIFCGILLFGTIRYLRQNERFYQETSETIVQYSEGNFERHLPCAEPGTIYRMCREIEQLAMALQTKTEAEHQGKEFLKQTISDISHQLKTPLAALNMYMEIILEEPEHVETVKKFVEKSQQSLMRMEQLIQNLLKISRLDAGSIVFDRKREKVAELIGQSCRDLWERAKAEEKEICFQGEEDAWLVCDFDWTREALGNLVKNALDHTEKGGKVQISWKRSPAMLRILIRDDGCGIAQEDIHHIFKRFYRSRNSTDTQGAGLGLPLAKSIIEGQGGMISVHSTPGQGAVFEVSFLKGQTPDSFYSYESVS